MRKKNVLISLFIIAILGFLIGGSSLAYFTDKDKNPEAVFVLGTVDIEAEAVRDVDITSDIHMACKNAKWIIKNTGSKAANIRARVITSWEAEGDCKLGRKETAWSYGTSFPGGNWAMYFTYNAQNGKTASVPLIAAKHDNVGTITITKDVENDALLIRINTDNTWRLNDIKLHVGESSKDFPINNGGNPKIGNFKYHSGNLGSVSSYNTAIPLKEIGDIETYYIAIHADVQECINGDNDNGDEPDYIIEVISGDWSYNANDGWYYYDETVVPQQEIDFMIKICLEDDWEGELDVFIEAEAVQASNNAIDYEW